jgi:hypothetical protein
MDNKVFNKYIEIIHFFEINKKNGIDELRMDLHFPWAVKILSAIYELSLQKEALVFVNKEIELETYITYPYLPQVIVFFEEGEKVNFWYKIEAEEKNQMVLLEQDKGFIPEYLLSRKAEIIREAILGQLNLEKFAEEFKKNIENSFTK